MDLVIFGMTCWPLCVPVFLHWLFLLFLQHFGICDICNSFQCFFTWWHCCCILRCIVFQLFLVYIQNRVKWLNDQVMIVVSYKTCNHDNFQGKGIPGTSLTCKLTLLAPKELLALQRKSMIMLISHSSPALLSNSSLSRGIWYSR